MAGPISLRQWNRTLLQRQHLLERVDEDVLDVLDRCVGLQSQDPRVAFFGLWSRITDFDPADLDDLMTGREVVRMALLRSTVFLMDSEDARWVRPLAQASMDGEMRNNHVKHLAGADPVEVAAQGRELLSGTELSVKALKEALSQRWPDAEAGSLVTVVRCLVPLVQVPPRGTWEGSATTTYSLYDDWCGPGESAVTGDEAVKDLIRLYLRGFGPSTIKGLQSWAGMTRLRPVVEAMEADWELGKLTGPDGEELFDIEGMALADESLSAPARLVAPFDNIVVSQGTDRRRVVDDEIFPKLVTPNGRSPGFVLVDGRVAGTWKPVKAGKKTTIDIDYLVKVSASGKREVEAERERLTAFCYT
ncbi:winged helix DNA-binding domain-containing protein [Williamsia sp.]|uniref:winged helix DNA-binding domain-containing protein n=1 Tax=Williamsia sp. TaxID=1872085 RepID=UPI002F95BBBB